MRPGVSTASYSAGSTFAATSGTWSTDYPVTNLSDLADPGRVARVAGGSASFTATLASASLVQIVALVGHTLAATDTIRVQAGAYDSGTVPAYAATRPFVFPAEISVSVVTVTLTFAAASVDIGALEIGRWWEWEINASADAGYLDAGDDIQLLGGGSVGFETFRPRTYAGQISYLDLATSSTTGLDFQKLQGLTRPFVFVEDADDPATWGRSCFLARNSEVPPMVAALFNRDTFQFRLREHVR